MQLRGKQRLALVAAMAVVVVGVFTLVRSSKAEKPPAAPVASNINGGTTATPEEIDRLKSYGLVQGEVPAGSQLRVGEELRNYALAGGSDKAELAAAQTGRIDGFYQAWIHTAARKQFTATFNLYNSPSSATSALTEVIKGTAGSGIQDLPDPKLGDLSHMYAFTSDQAGSRYEGWRVQWVRGRTLFVVDGLSPPGDLHQDDVLNAALRIDARAQKAPIK